MSDAVDIARIGAGVMVMLKHNEQAETVALQALAYLAGDEERLQRFLLLTGLTIDDVKARAQDTGFLSGVLDHLLSDEPLLLEFAADAAIDPESIMIARRRFPGVSEY
ncbi:MAG: DUF3572 domain-containing protein [Alphaproteobacteria bacterium]|nr:DUF3572 domain-containing protein [Alphaproteobacteria bacterium]